jgi:hypothetical protein
MASSNDSCGRLSRAQHLARRAARGICVASVMFVLACATGETGEPCWSGGECTSGSCSFGTCDSGLFELLAELVEATEKTPAHDEQPATLRDEPACGSLDESSCNAASSCFVRITCIPPGWCVGAASSDEILACVSCYDNGCGDPCTRLYQCEGW